VCLNIILRSNRGNLLFSGIHDSYVSFIGVNRQDLRRRRSGWEGCAINIVNRDDRSRISQVRGILPYIPVSTHCTTTCLNLRSHCSSFSFRYGEKAAAATNEGMDAAGHAIGTAWAVFKIRQAINPKSVLKPTSLAKSTIKARAADLRSSKSSKSKKDSKMS
jgi:hypothetical protein